MLWTVAQQAPLSMGFSRQEHWSGLLFSSPGDLPNPGIEPASLMSPALAAAGKAVCVCVCVCVCCHSSSISCSVVSQPRDQANSLLSEPPGKPHVCVCVCMYIYIYMYMCVCV